MNILDDTCYGAFSFIKKKFLLSETIKNYYEVFFHFQRVKYTNMAHLYQVLTADAMNDRTCKLSYVNLCPLCKKCNHYLPLVSNSSSHLNLGVR